MIDYSCFAHKVGNTVDTVVGLRMNDMCTSLSCLKSPEYLLDTRSPLVEVCTFIVAISVPGELLLYHQHRFFFFLNFELISVKLTSTLFYLQYSFRPNPNNFLSPCSIHQLRSSLLISSFRRE